LRGSFLRNRVLTWFPSSNFINKNYLSQKRESIIEKVGDGWRNGNTAPKQRKIYLVAKVPLLYRRVQKGTKRGGLRKLGLGSPQVGRSLCRASPWGLAFLLYMENGN